MMVFPSLWYFFLTGYAAMPVKGILDSCIENLNTPYFVPDPNITNGYHSVSEMDIIEWRTVQLSCRNAVSLEIAGQPVPEIGFMTASQVLNLDLDACPAPFVLDPFINVNNKKAST